MIAMIAAERIRIGLHVIVHLIAIGSADHPIFQNEDFGSEKAAL